MSKFFHSKQTSPEDKKNPSFTFKRTFNKLGGKMFGKMKTYQEPLFYQ